jgi:hypothetical protein
MSSLKLQLEAIPQKNFYRANRYNTDNQLILHIWDEETQQSYDIIAPKKWVPEKICAKCQKPIGRSHKFIQFKGGKGHKIEHRNCDDPICYR